MEGPHHDDAAGPDGSVLLADTTGVLGFHVGDRPCGGPPSEQLLESSGQPPEAERPRGTSIQATPNRRAQLLAYSPPPPASPQRPVLVLPGGDVTAGLADGLVGGMVWAPVVLMI
ncbi:hypothetical protein ACF05L_32190 [Streptomyces bobili]|uniref:hypothetical protein n=1 Tax=Streptomyces bobili TaxID=67280 RepID=UPI0036F5735D